MSFFVFNDQRLFYRDHGNGPLLLIIPGNTASSASHEDDLAWFGDLFRAVSIDCIGTGASERLEQWPDHWFEQNALAAISLMEQIEAERAAVMGSGGGGIIALLTAIFSPARISAVVADGCMAYLTGEWLAREMAAREAPSPSRAAFWRNAHGDDWEAVVRADGDFLLRFVENDGNPFKGRLKNIRCPVLLTASLNDGLVPGLENHALQMAKRIRDCRAFLVSTEDHPLMWNRPDEFRRISRTFLAGHLAAGADVHGEPSSEG